MGVGVGVGVGGLASLFSFIISSDDLLKSQFLQNFSQFLKGVQMDWLS